MRKSYTTLVDNFLQSLGSSWEELKAEIKYKRVNKKWIASTDYGGGCIIEAKSKYKLTATKKIAEKFYKLFWPDLKRSFMIDSPLTKTVRTN